MKKCLSLSRSKKKSYAAALGPERKPGEVYNGDILYHTGISNVARNCYLSAIMQCCATIRRCHLSFTNSLQAIPITAVVNTVHLVSIRTRPRMFSLLYACSHTNRPNVQPGCIEDAIPGVSLHCSRYYHITKFTASFIKR